MTIAETILYDLMSWLSPSYPVGAFAHSSGLEWAVQAGHVRDRASTESWITDALTHGGLGVDAIIFVHAHRAADTRDAEGLAGLAELATAILTSRERRLEATGQGAAFRKIARATAPTAPLAMLDGIADEDLSYPLVVGCLTAGHGVPITPALTAYLHGGVANLVSAAQRLIPLGQTDGQLVMRALRSPLLAAVEKALATPDIDPFEQMGSASLYADIATMAHETQYTRLFRT